ncbi:hypothetical protein DM77_3412 [Burkholderia mallei]|nr:hypothetical protein DP56_6123 [Burkholderia pseudomallei]KOT10883.1 hypothetical protein DM77_3412 [Burkholderia mallei]
MRAAGRPGRSPQLGCYECWNGPGTPKESRILTLSAFACFTVPDVVAIGATPEVRRLRAANPVN